MKHSTKCAALLLTFPLSNLFATANLPLKLGSSATSGTQVVMAKALRSTKDSSGYAGGGMAFAVTAGGQVSVTSANVAVYAPTKVTVGTNTTLTANTSGGYTQATTEDVTLAMGGGINCVVSGSTCTATGTVTNYPLYSAAPGADDTVSYEYAVNFGSWVPVSNQDLNGSASFAIPVTFAVNDDVSIRKISYSKTSSPTYTVAYALDSGAIPSCACFDF